MSAISNQIERSPAEAARELAALVRARGADIEMSQRLPADVANAVRTSGLLRLLMPRELGGDGGWQPAFDAVEAVARGDGSTGWSLMIGMTINMLTGYVDRREALELFFGSSPLFVAGVFEPRGIGRREGETFRVSGRWRFATGVHVADWFCATAAVPLDTGQEVRHFFVPASSLAVHPNWNVIGLCGTGSDDVELSSVAVDPRRSFTLDDAPWPDDPLWHVPFYSITALLMAAALLGMARGGMDSVVAKAATASGALSRFGRNQCLEVEVATAEATIRSARAFVLDAMNDIDVSIRKGNPPTERQRALLWLAAIHAARSCGETLDVLFSGEGASGIRRDSPLQRSWRDVRAAGKHVVLARQRLEAVGRVLLGAPSEARPFL
jgi:alkylation response protein AidB-like acyl-CoA dehydrogenase